MRVPFSIALAALAVTACGHSSMSGAPAPAAGADAKAAAPAAMPPGVTADLIARGDAVFNTKSCFKCHGMKGAGGVNGPNLTDDHWVHIDGSYQAIVGLVTTGFTKAEQREPRYRFPMNPRGGVNLSDAEISAVAAYVWSLSHATK